MAEARTDVRRAGRPRSAEVEVAAVEAVIGELIDRGYEGLTMEAVASRAGIAKSTLYRRWPSKDELVLESLGALRGPVPQAPGGTVRDDLVFLIDWMRRAWMDTRHGEVMRRLLGEAVGHPELYATYRDRIVAPRQKSVLEVLQRGVDQGVIRPDAPLPAVLHLLVSPTLARGLTGGPRLTKADAEFVVDTVLAGLAP